MISKYSILTLLTASLSIFSSVNAASDVLELTAADFDDTMKQHPLVLAEFFAPWVNIAISECKLMAVWTLQGISTRI